MSISLPPALLKKVMSTENFVVVKVKGTTAHIEAFKPDGGTIDSADVRP